mmetsp:Transcript_15243/g.32841  ORF Transcript_15243/g.32841 Transcript_15243/m.32841 type:complete len:290 (-) Transcript_15243:2644-3513(-)
MASFATLPTTTRFGLHAFCKPSGTKYNTASKKVRASASQPRASKPLKVYAGATDATIEGRMECVNPFRDDWELVKSTGERLANETSVINDYLTDVGIQPVRPRDVQRLMKEEGYALIDTRQQWSYDEWYLESAVHIPLKREIEGSGFAKSVRKFGHALFVEFPTSERNFDGSGAWLETITRMYPSRDAKLIIGCDIGGLLDEDPSKRFPSLTLESMFYLKNLGYNDVKYVQGGFCAWRKDSALLEKTVGVKGELPWFKKVNGLRSFFPAPCDWSYVSLCACKDCSGDEQ